MSLALPRRDGLPRRDSHRVVMVSRVEYVQISRNERTSTWVPPIRFLHIPLAGAAMSVGTFHLNFGHSQKEALKVKTARKLIAAYGAVGWELLVVTMYAMFLVEQGASLCSRNACFARLLRGDGWQLRFRFARVHYRRGWQLDI